MDIFKSKIDNYDDSVSEIVALPCIQLEELEILPYAAVSFSTRDKKNAMAFDEAMSRNSMIYVTLKKGSGYHPYGVKCSFSCVVRLDSTRIKVMLEGIEKVRFTEFEKAENGVLFAKAETVIEHSIVSDEDFAVYKKILSDSVDSIVKGSPLQPMNYILDSLKKSTSLEEAIYIAMMLIQDKESRKYELLAEENVSEKLKIVMTAINEEKLYSEVLADIEHSVQEKIGRHNREFILREQRNIIDEQLGDIDGDDGIDELEKGILKLKASDSVKLALSKELKRMQRMPETAPESSIIRNYLEWALELPWDNLSEDTNDIDKVIEVLNEDHYGINDVKERIAEYIAVRMLSKDNSAGTSLCLVGPPGVGKTTIAKSIARALNKDFAQLTLGGVHDEATIRGHRRTYIGAMSGRVLASLTRCKTNNPVFLLDEADKITRDMRGDPQSALLEVLDPNQNKIFRDNYLDIPYDLSNVMFIVTANDISALDKPLLDRLEVIHIDGYMPDEKLSIAKQYLIPKQEKLCGLADGTISFTDGAILEIIDGYTRESGVRELERKIASICRKIVFEKVKSKDVDTKIIVDISDIEKYLKLRIYKKDAAENKGAVGKVVGLAWNGYGGSALDIEAIVLSGKGEIKLTGNLGDIMKESAHIALSLVKQRAAEFGLDTEFFDKHDIHIHVPEGAIPKDGPSAGVTLATAILSAVTGKKVNGNIAMTGEVSLMGRVLPIGGLREKSLAADRLGISRVLIPRDNEKDLAELPDGIKERVKFIGMDSVDDVFKLAISE